jgi:hypothetical protein
VGTGCTETRHGLEYRTDPPRPPQGTTAVAHKLARITYHLVTTRQAYDENVLAQHERQRRARNARRLHAQAATLGFKLVPGEAA